VDVAAEYGLMPGLGLKTGKTRSFLKIVEFGLEEGCAQRIEPVWA
jgi:hypothetical protein